MSFPEQAVRSLVITTGMKNAGKGNAAGYFPHGSAFPLPSTPHQNMTDEKMSTEGTNEIQDPRGEFQQERYEKQQQKAPGLQSGMKPVPDSGEQSYHGCNRLRGRKALVTGGDSGIGRAAAIAYAREGALVAGKQVAVEDIRDITTEQLTKTFEVNVFSLFWIAKEALPHLKPGTSIITCSSIQAYQPGKNLVDYASTKAAIIAFSRSLAKQVAPKGIRVNVVAPGPIWTALQVTGGQLQKDLPEFGRKTPLKRAGQPVELSGLYVFLASQESSFITAEVFGVTGGMHLA